MLVLSRKKDESLVICDRIVVTVIRIRKGAVQIGIEAPRDVSIQRSELQRSTTPGGADKSPAADVDGA